MFKSLGLLPILTIQFIQFQKQEYEEPDPVSRINSLYASNLICELVDRMGETFDFENSFREGVDSTGEITSEQLTHFWLTVFDEKSSFDFSAYDTEDIFLVLFTVGAIVHGNNYENEKVSELTTDAVLGITQTYFQMYGADKSREFINEGINMCLENKVAEEAMVNLLERLAEVKDDS